MGQTWTNIPKCYYVWLGVSPHPYQVNSSVYYLYIYICIFIHISLYNKLTPATMEFSNGIKGLTQHLDIVDASPRLNYCGWLRKILHHDGWNPINHGMFTTVFNWGFGFRWPIHSRCGKPMENHGKPIAMEQIVGSIMPNKNWVAFQHEVSSSYQLCDITGSSFQLAPPWQITFIFWSFA